MTVSASPEGRPPRRRASRIGVLFVVAVAIPLILGLLLRVYVNDVNFPAPQSSTTVPPSTSTTEPSDPLQEALERLTRGRILFNPPRTTVLGRTERIEARIARSDIEDLTLGLKGSGPPTITPLPEVSAYMSAELGGRGFTIAVLSERDQPIGAQGFALWEWDVVSGRSGKQTLQLRVSMRVPLEGRPDERRSLPVLERTIDVQVDPGYSARTFWSRNWQWLLGFLAPVLVGGTGLLWRRSKGEDAPRAS